MSKKVSSHSPPPSAVSGHACPGMRSVFKHFAISSRVSIAALSLAALQCGTDASAVTSEAPQVNSDSHATTGDSTARGSTNIASDREGGPDAGAEGTAPSVEAPSGSTPSAPSEAPSAEAPATGTPATGAPSAGAPSAQNPPSGASSEDPASHAPPADSAPSEDPTSQGSAGDSPSSDEPAGGGTASNPPVSSEPSTDASPDDPWHDPPVHGGSDSGGSPSDDSGSQEPAPEQPTDNGGGVVQIDPVAPPAMLHVAARFVPPLPAEIAEGAGIVRNRDWALALGKALFWDSQVGSDGQACGSCHFNAGADSRITAELNPGFLDETRGPGGDELFGSDRSDTGVVAVGRMPSGNAAGPGTTLSALDFPLHRLLDETNRDSSILTDTSDAVGSIGAFAAVFSGIDEHGMEKCTSADDPVFHITGKTGQELVTRQVTARNSPSTINAAFNVRQFWDGRANNSFNGVGVFGQRELDGDRNLRLIVMSDAGSPELGALSLENASLASQAVGPPLSSVEMSCEGRKFADLGRKIARSAPLAKQQVDPSDSVLGGLARTGGAGLQPEYSYSWLIQQAFAPKYWSAPGKFRIVNGALTPAADGYSQLESNMSMFWGIAIMLYESTLISDTSEFDGFVQTGDIKLPSCEASAGVDPLLARGCKIFFRSPFGAPPADGVKGAGCAFCHSGTDTFTEAGVQAGKAFTPLLQVNDVNNLLATRDLGFANIGVRPAFVDVGVGGKDPFGNPLSFGRQYREFVSTGDRSVVTDPFLLKAIDNNALVRAGTVVNPNAKLESDGATKIPSIRNAALTPPYFSYGGYANLRQVMKFYNRGGSRRTLTAANQALEAHAGSTCQTGDSTGTGADGNSSFPVTNADCNTNVTGLMRPLGLLDCDANGVVTCDVATDDLSAVVRFIESLSDRRVQCDQAPFDHPELQLPHGYTGSSGERYGAAADLRFVLPAVGATGYDPKSGLCIPNAGDLFAPGMQGRVGGVRVPLAP